VKDSILETTKRALGARRLQEQEDVLATWRGNRKSVDEAAKRYKDPGESTKVLVIQGSDRNKATCPGEAPKSLRLAEHAVKVLKRQGVEPHLLDLSRMTSEKDRMIWPCKGCFSTSAALCHYPCSCYPFAPLNQDPDWMNDEIYSRLVESHALMVICPVYWYAPPSVLKLMLDRMVCMDGANPDPKSTMADDGSHVKDTKKARTLERGPRAGGESIWKYKRGKIMAGRIYSLYVHGDADGADLAEASISKTLEWYGCIPAGPYAKESGYVGYYKPYANNQQELDKAEEVWHTIERQAKAVAVAVKKAREAGMPVPAMPPDSEMK